MPDVNQEQLFALIGGLCNKTLTDLQICQLDRILMENEEARALYEEYLFLHAQLYTEVASHTLESGGLESACVDIRIDPPEAEDCSSKVAGRTNPSRRQRGSRSAFTALAIGAAAMAAWLSGIVSLQSPFRDEKGSVAASGYAGNSEVVAQVTSTRNCRWEGDSKKIGFGSALRSGEVLKLSEGWAEITFEDGARVILEGPARFRIDAADRGALEWGRLSAAVPLRARGFEVATTAVNIVDLGTEFGLIASEMGSTEVHVFNGLVEAQLRDASRGAEQTINLQTHEAAFVANDLSRIERFVARDSDFVRTITPSPRPQQGIYAYEGFDYPEGPLAWQNGGFGWAGPWVNIEAAPDEQNSNRVDPGNLVYEGIAPNGNHAGLVSQQNRIRRALSTSLGGVFDAAGLVENQDAQRLIGQDGAVVYVSVLQQVSQVGDGFYGVELHRGDGNGNRVVCVGNGAEGTGYGVTSNYNMRGETYQPEGTLEFPELGDENSDINFLVLKLSFGQGDQDRLEVFRNPESLTDETLCSVDATLEGNLAFDRVSLGNFDGSKTHRVDELRIGTSYVAVAGQEPTQRDRVPLDLARLDLPHGKWTNRYPLGGAAHPKKTRFPALLGRMDGLLGSMPVNSARKAQIGVVQ